MTSVTVKVPASTSNLGSGFDTLGLAVQLDNQIGLTRRKDKRLRLASTISATDRPAAEALVRDASDAFFAYARLKSFGADVSCAGEVPIARGLGYSATLRAGIIAGLARLSGLEVSQEDLITLVTRLEGHPDNATPAVAGGFTVSGIVDDRVRYSRFDVDPNLKIVTLIPNFKIRTSAARKLVPKNFSKADAAHALNRSALIVAAFASRNYEALRGVFDDRFHQPHRAKLVPQLQDVIAAGVSAGAIGGFLSGSGSSIICLTLRNADAVAAAMHSQLRDSEVKILSPDNIGLMS
jgi:homoserine kinase